MQKRNETETPPEAESDDPRFDFLFVRGCAFGLPVTIILWLAIIYAWSKL